MDTITLKKITIVAEAVLEERLIREMRQLGARGYTLSEVRGDGSRGVRASEWEGKNIQLEILASAETADRVLTHVSERYFAHYAVVVWLTDVQVIRGNRYV